MKGPSFTALYMVGFRTCYDIIDQMISAHQIYNYHLCSSKVVTIKPAILVSDRFIGSIRASMPYDIEKHFTY